MVVMTLLRKHFPNLRRVKPKYRNDNINNCIVECNIIIRRAYRY